MKKRDQYLQRIATYALATLAAFSASLHPYGALAEEKKQNKIRGSFSVSAAMTNEAKMYGLSASLAAGKNNVYKADLTLNGSRGKKREDHMRIEQTIEKKWPKNGEKRKVSGKIAISNVLTYDVVGLNRTFANNTFAGGGIEVETDYGKFSLDGGAGVLVSDGRRPAPTVNFSASYRKKFGGASIEAYTKNRRGESPAEREDIVGAKAVIEITKKLKLLIDGFSRRYGRAKNYSLKLGVKLDF